MKKMQIAVSSSLLAVSIGMTPGVGHAVSAVAGSTEPTQIMNNIELALANVKLLQQYRKQIEMVIKQVESVRALEKNLEKLDPRRAQRLLRDFRGVRSIDELRDVIRASNRLGDTLAGLDRDITSILYEHDRATRVIGALNTRNVRVSGGHVLRGMHRLARERGGEYERRVAEYTRAINSAQKNIERVEAITQDAPQIESSVQGLAALQVSSGQMLAQLADMQTVNAQVAIDIAKVAAVADSQAIEQVSDRVGTDIILMDLIGADAFNRAKSSSR